MNLKEFENPSAIYRPGPFWSWNDKLDKEELKRQIGEMADKGWGSYFMHSRVGLVTGYLSEEWMEMIRTCAEEARKTGTYAWLYDEDKWPSGFAGGEVPEMDEKYRSRGLVLLLEVELTEQDTVLCETVMDGQKYCICKRVTPLGNVWFNGASYVDLMNPEAVGAFIKCTHERYKEACGEYFGKEIPGIFTDEPCYLMENHYNVPVLPWSDYLPGFFEKTKGYPLEEQLEQLFFDTGDYQKVRFDFFDCATRLFLESFTKQYYDWCEANRLKMTGHFMAEDNLVYQLQWVGAAMPHYQFMHWPGIDKLGRHIEQLVTVKQLTSVADQLGKERSFSEVFGCVGQQVSFFHRKWIADWQAALGVSFVNHHLSLYSMRGERKRDYPANLFYQQPWWEEEKTFGDYIGRLSYAVSTGVRKVDILVLHPVASVWSEYSPVHKQNGMMVENKIYNEPFEKLSKELIANKLDFHYGDEIIMESHAKVENGKLIVGKNAYSTVIIPPCCTLSGNTVRLLEEFVSAAGQDRLIFVQRTPDRVDGVRREIPVTGLGTKASSIRKALEQVDALYAGRIRATDCVTGRNAPEIVIHQRDTDSGETILLSNTDEKREIQTVIRIPGEGICGILDLLSGKRYKAPVVWENGETVLKVTFYPAGSLLLYRGDSSDSFPAVPAVLDSGVAFGEFNTSFPIDRKWEVTLQDKNVLPLNDITLYLNGSRVLDRQPVSKGWHEHFYIAPDGTPFQAVYHFPVMEIPGGALFAAIECAENLDRITLNGHEVRPLKHRGELGAFDGEKSWMDINFTIVPLKDFVRTGENSLVLEGRKVNNITSPGCHSRVRDFENHEATEAEVVYLVGDFKVVGSDREAFAITSGTSAACGMELTSGGYPFYAGKAQFSTEFDLKEAKDGDPVLLRVDQVDAACIRLKVNGKDAGVKYWAPYIFDIGACLKPGINKIEITAATTLFNLMGPNRISGILEDTGVGPHTFVSFDRYTKKVELLPFGVGGITLLSRK